MAESWRYSLNAQLDIDQILLEAQHRWLRPAEICEILRNYEKFCLSPEPPNRPPSGSLFLFDRKVLRYFRKDGHNWRKKKDGKTVKEAHERLKAGSIDVLHCYYAHGEEDQTFQRRSYWLLEEELCHIVLVHYREVKANRTNFNRISESEVIPDSQEPRENLPNSEVGSFVSSEFQPYSYEGTSQVTDSASLNSAHASEFEDAESVYCFKQSPGFQSFDNVQQPMVRKIRDGSIPYFDVPISDNYQGQFSAVTSASSESITQREKDKNSMDNGLTYELHSDLGFQSWENDVESSIDGYQAVNFQPPLSSAHSSIGMMLGQENELLGQVVSNAMGKSHEFGIHSNGLEESQEFGIHSNGLEEWPWSMDQKLHENSRYDPYSEMDSVNNEKLHNAVGPCNTYPANHSTQPMHSDHQKQDMSAELGSSLKSQSYGNLNVDDNAKNPALRQPCLDGLMREGLKKLDSFDRWMSNELGDVTESQMQPGSGPSWETVGVEGGGDDSGISAQVPLDNYILGPSLSQDQLFSIDEFSPNWAYAGSEIKVVIMGKFLRSHEEVEKYKWACMFGELEVPAEIIADGVLCCRILSQKTGRVPFYVTCSNRLACSEVREFEFRTTDVQVVDIADAGSIISSETALHMRFGKLLSLGSVQTSVQKGAAENDLCSKISSLLKDDSEWEQMLNLTTQDEFSVDRVQDQLLQKLLKEKLYYWLLQKVAEGGKGPNILDEGGQGVLHFAAALGYEWAIQPTIAAGVSVNFRDANGWTALHWAAYYGRERMVAFLISIGAAPGALTDPTPKCPSGRTPADLASCNGHKGIAGYLAESALSEHLVSLDLKNSKEGNNEEKAVETVSERTATLVGYGDLPHGLSLKDSLAAVRNATQAAARIHQVFRVQSFQRKQTKEYGDGEFGMSDERVLSLLSVKGKKTGRHDEPMHSAAISIQNKFRSWKGRKEYLLIRQRIIKIQAHVRGHQVRKNYKKIIWSVGILDKVILRWRRKGRGLSSFKPEALTAGTSMQVTEPKEDDYDFLKEGRKQTEERLQKALARVKSMVQYPEARDQYRRLLNVVSEMQETKADYDTILNNPDVNFDDDLIDLEVKALLEDDTFMPTAT
ncbi:calmodulin-binding transcription activator 3 [Olea europaea subsp. europaea]|uniref:Calmodulin-binding transcription activator 3 n=1 Tax=Olea europaea subsp. europaea TaxID=158383 RepID=A0A8S0VHZ3_OLEEU|nr:calmodulin-binding transcription activator 3 [Olea europaea subsp. europaea]